MKLIFIVSGEDANVKQSKWNMAEQRSVESEETSQPV